MDGPDKFTMQSRMRKTVDPKMAATQAEVVVETKKMETKMMAKNRP
jgi:hypothetical protein